MKPSDFNRIQHIVRYCDEIAETMARFGSEEESFFADKDYRKSIALSLLEIGELAKGLSSEFRGDTKEMHWNLIIGMRNTVAHQYSKIELDTLFNTARIEVPQLKAFCETVLEKHKIPKLP